MLLVVGWLFGGQIWARYCDANRTLLGRDKVPDRVLRTILTLHLHIFTRPQSA